MNTHRVFVYGTLKLGNHNHRLLAGSRLVGVALTSRKFPLVVDALPYLLNHKGRGFQVAGEVYEVNDATLADLDRLEGHPRFYRRRLIDTTQGEAWAYFLENPSPEIEALPSQSEF